jgi:hypothetical protein
MVATNLGCDKFDASCDNYVAVTDAHLRIGE